MSQQDWLEKDYYKVLGLKKDATPDQIKKAFRKLARENHPDQNKDPKAEQRFKEISEAHDVLSDPDQRKQYDELRSLAASGGGFRFPGSGAGPAGARGQANANLDDLLGNSGLGDIFGGLFGGGSRTAGRGPRRGRDIETEARMSFLDAASGIQTSVRLTSDTACQACHGLGAKDGTLPRICPTCHGMGMSARQSGGFAVSEPCPTCHGTGQIIDSPCPVCHGSGRGTDNRSIQVRIPAGVTDGQRIRIKGKGGPGANGGAAGDLYVLVHVEPDKLFSRQGDNLAITVQVTYAEAALGAAIDVPTLDGGHITLKIPAGTPSGRTFRAQGKGIALKKGPTDLLVTVEVQVPAQLSPEARAALEAYVKAVGEPDPRNQLRSER